MTMGTRLIWKHRLTMVEKAAAIKTAHFIVKGSEWIATRKWWEEHIHQHATFEIGDVADSNMEAITKRFWGDVRKLRVKAVREYHQLSAPERAVVRERMVATLEAAPRPTSAPAAIPAVSVALDLPLAKQALETAQNDEVVQSTIPTPSPAKSGNSKRLSCPVSNVFYGGDLTLELGLAECFRLLRENQISAAAKGVDYLDALWEGYDNG